VTSVKGNWAKKLVPNNLVFVGGSFYLNHLIEIVVSLTLLCSHFRSCFFVSE
jgi:hypothetical protein